MLNLNKIQLELILQIIYKTYKLKEIDTNEKIIDIIANKFNAVCTTEQIFNHHTSKSSDDFEREHRRIQYGYNYDTFTQNN